MTTSRIWLTVGLGVAALIFGGWRMLVPGADETTQAAGESAQQMISTVSQAFFTSAETSLEAQRAATGSYAGTPVQEPLTLVRADASSYCIQLDRPPLLQHVNGPNGTPEPGACS